MLLFSLLKDAADLADPELAEAAVIEQFLPQQLSEAEVAVMVDAGH